MTQTAPPPLPPKPPSRQDRVSLRTYARLFRRDILSAQPARLYGAWMAVFRTPFFRSFLINDPKLVDMVLKKSLKIFPNRTASMKVCARCWEAPFLSPTVELGAGSGGSLIPHLRGGACITALAPCGPPPKGPPPVLPAQQMRRSRSRWR